MNNNIQYIALYTIVRREMGRMLRIANQMFLPSVITTTLYFLVFGTLIGRRIGNIGGIPYPLFIAPGLIMMSVINNSYSHVSSSLFLSRFQRNIEELLISPLSNAVLLTGYIIGGVLRGFIIAILVFLIAMFFVPEIHLQQLPATLGVVLCVSTIFSLAGFTNALFAKTFDDIMLVPTFLLTPLTYLGGVFYATSMLSPFWATLSHFNPIWYMINALRHTMIHYTEVNFTWSLLSLLVLMVSLVCLNLWLLHRGVGLKE